MIRKLSIACLAIGAVLLMAAAPFHQKATPPATLGFGELAKTYCMVGKTDEGKDTAWARTAIDLKVTQDSALLEEVTAHELIHQAWYNSHLNECGHLTPRLALSLEVDAYCRTADIPVHYGGDSSRVYFRNLTWLVAQFNRNSNQSLPYNDVVSAWYIRCSSLLPLNRPPVTRDTSKRG